MLYVTGIFALNLTCNLDTCGDWHTSALNWQKVTLVDSDTMFFRDYGIEQNRSIPEHDGKYGVANHIRALLDLLEIGNFSVAQGMNNDFICNEFYNKEIFNHVYSMKSLDRWKQIDEFMGKEYMMKWFRFKTEKEKTNER